MDASADTTLVKQLRTLSKGPLYCVKRYPGYKMHGVVFHCKYKSMIRSFENNGVLCKADTTWYNNTQDNNLISGDIDYYEVLLDVLQLEYLDNIQVVLLNFLWYNVLSEGNELKVDDYGFTCVNHTNVFQTHEPFILVSQANQIF